jgi:RNA polymerase sigma factor (sigma-70 family)
MRRSVPPFQDFLEKNREVVYRFLLASVGSAEADDCFQDTFLSALRAYPRLRDGSNLRGWVLTIATRKAIDAHRARARRPSPTADIGTEDPAPASPELDGSLWEAVRGLPARQRAALAHRFVLDLSYREIADAIGGSEEAARANVYQGLRTLRRTRPDLEEGAGDD